MKKKKAELDSQKFNKGKDYKLLCPSCAEITLKLLDDKEKGQEILIKTMRNELKVLRKIVSEQPDYEKGIKELQSQFELLYKLRMEEYDKLQLANEKIISLLTRIEQLDISSPRRKLLTISQGEILLIPKKELDKLRNETAND